MTKICSTCNILKAHDKFYKQNDRIGIASQCKECKRTYAKSKWHNNPLWAKQKTRDGTSKATLRLYGVSDEQYFKMLVEQKYSCAICHIHQSTQPTAFHIDHNHLTGKVRGLLCLSCNVKVGYFEKIDFSPIRYYLGVI